MNKASESKIGNKNPAWNGGPVGGTNWIANIQPLCRSCNSKKHNRIIKYSHVDNDYRYERSNINGLRRDFD